MTTADVLKAILQRVEEDENTLCYEVEGIMDLLLAHSKAGGFVMKWAHRMTIATYVSEVAQLVHRASGFHFTAKKTTAERLREFNIDEIASRMSILAPNLWSLFDLLLAADPKINYKRGWRSGKVPDTPQRADDDVDMLDVHDLDEDEDEYWRDDADECPLIGDEEDEPEDAEDQKKQRAERLIMTVSVIQHVEVG